MTKVTAFLILFSLAFNFSYAQNEILAQGKITDSRTSKGIKANVRYSSIPTGSIFGRFSDSTFSFPIFGTAKYQITAEAKGYNPRTVIVDPKDIGANNRVQRDIILTPSGETMRLENLIFPQGKGGYRSEIF
jgi:hypothetical protein